MNSNKHANVVSNMKSRTELSQAEPSQATSSWFRFTIDCFNLTLLFLIGHFVDSLLNYFAVDSKQIYGQEFMR